MSLIVGISYFEVFVFVFSCFPTFLYLENKLQQLQTLSHAIRLEVNTSKTKWMQNEHSKQESSL